MTDITAALVKRLISVDPAADSLTGLSASAQFEPAAKDAQSLAASLNAAFLLALAGGQGAGAARSFLAGHRAHQDLGGLADFLSLGLLRLPREMARAVADDPTLTQRIARAEQALAGSGDGPAFQPVWEVLFPEGLTCLADREAAVKALQERRKVTIRSLNPDPVTDPIGEVLFTANTLLTTPLPGSDLDSLYLSSELKERIRAWQPGEQLYWYDHPIPLGASAESNEVLHGLSGLSQALAFEQERRGEWAKARLSCVCSLSVTHQGLQDLARDYLAETLKQNQGLKGLDLYLFSERETDRLKEEVLFPAAERYFPRARAEALAEIIGVDGEYGRHYSFLKALAPLWQVLLDPQIKATFKIDLDQVFPQRELTSQGGASAWEHFMSPLWGARGVDAWGKEVELGLLAGALVNQSDIGQGIFTPDVPWPDRQPVGEEMVFFSALPQALSTEAEMLTRYDRGGLDGQGACLQRIHVTGGTTGALLRSLRRHRPFTPTFIGRAEDQAYLLSVLFSGTPRLRYLHQPGLIMRHDKQSLIPQAMAAARVGKIIGDYVRTLWFSYYCRALPWSLGQIKQAIDPFTGCFVSALPFHLVYLRLTLKAAGLFAQQETAARVQAQELLVQGSRRLGKIIAMLEADPDALARRLELERQGWDLFYDILDRLEQGLSRGEKFAAQARARAADLAAFCRV